MERKTIRCFVSSASTDSEYADDFKKRFQEMCAPAKDHMYQFWDDSKILAGEDWKNEIRKALDKCDLGLLLVSPAFLGSKFIQDEELPKLVGKLPIVIITLMLKMVHKQQDLKGLERTQIFRLRVEDVQRLKSFAQCSDSQRDDFVYELFGQVEDRLRK